MKLIPLGKIKDFSPYITKIKASGAQALLTGNWGPDMNLLIKAGVDAGADLRYYTFYAHLAGGPTAIGVGGDNRVLAVMSFGKPRPRSAMPKPRHLLRHSATSTSSTSLLPVSAPSLNICKRR